MSNLNLAGMIGDAVGGKKKMQFKVGDENDIGSEIEAEVKKKIKKEFEDE
jgi:hypothetical protein